MARKKNKIWVQFNRIGAVIRYIEKIGFQHDLDKESIRVAIKLEDIANHLREEVKRRKDGLDN